MDSLPGGAAASALMRHSADPIIIGETPEDEDVWQTLFGVLPTSSILAAQIMLGNPDQQFGRDWAIAATKKCLQSRARQGRPVTVVLDLDESYAQGPVTGRHEIQANTLDGRQLAKMDASAIEKSIDASDSSVAVLVTPRRDCESTILNWARNLDLQRQVAPGLSPLVWLNASMAAWLVHAVAWSCHPPGRERPFSTEPFKAKSGGATVWKPLAKRLSSAALTDSDLDVVIETILANLRTARPWTKPAIAAVKGSVNRFLTRHSSMCRQSKNGAAGLANHLSRFVDCPCGSALVLIRGHDLFAILAALGTSLGRNGPIPSEGRFRSLAKVDVAVQAAAREWRRNPYP